MGSMRSIPKFRIIFYEPLKLLSTVYFFVLELIIVLFFSFQCFNIQQSNDVPTVYKDTLFLSKWQQTLLEYVNVSFFFLFAVTRL